MLSYYIIIKVLRSQDRIKDTKKSTNHHIARMAMVTMSAQVTSLITIVAIIHVPNPPDTAKLTRKVFPGVLSLEEVKTAVTTKQLPIWSR